MRKLIIKIKKLYKYFKILWESEDFDYFFLLDLERMKLQDMYTYFKDAKWTNDEWEHARDCKLAVSLLNIILGYDNIDDVNDSENTQKYVNVKNMSRFVNQFICDKYNKLLSGEVSTTNPVDINIMIACYKDEIRRQKAWKLYCDLRERKLLTWAD